MLPEKFIYVRMQGCMRETFLQIIGNHVKIVNGTAAVNAYFFCRESHWRDLRRQGKGRLKASSL
jgi:hypothetical protein